MLRADVIKALRRRMLADVIEEKETDELETYKGKWINYYFKKDGSSAPDTETLFNTEEEAAKEAAEDWAFLRESYDHYISIDKDGIIIFEAFEDTLSHIIQLPIGVGHE